MSKEREKIETPAGSGHAKSDKAPRWQVTIIAVLAIFIACLAAYFNSFPGQFVYDDITIVLKNPVVIKGPWEGLNSNRPIIGLVFSLNYDVSGRDPWDYHLINMMIHFFAATALFGVIRRTLDLPKMPAALSGNSAVLAGAISILWAVHPLDTESVTFIMQRSESLMGLFFLLTMYFMIRAGISDNRVPWSLAAAGSFILGIGCKETIVTAPILVLLYYIIFLAPTGETEGGKSCGIIRRVGWAVKKGWVFYAVLLISGLVIFAVAHGRILQILARAGNETANEDGFTPINYAMTQCKSICNYLALSFWPDSLCLDYRWPVSQSFGEIWIYALIIGLLLAGTLVALWRWPMWSFLGLWFFINLAPRSSFYPRPDVIVEHRMYLPLMAVVSLVVLGAYFTGLRFIKNSANREKAARLAIITGSTLWAIITVALIVRTASRNFDYYSEVDIWRATVAVSPGNYRARSNLGRAFATRAESQDAKPDDLTNAIDQFKESIKIRPQPAVYKNLAVAYMRKMTVLNDRINQYDISCLIDAACTLMEGIRTFPQYGELYFWIRKNASMLESAGQTEMTGQIAGYLQQLVEIQPDNMPARIALANVLMINGNYAQAANQYRQVVQNQPNNLDAMRDFAWLLATCPVADIRNGRDAVDMATKACQATDYQDSLTMSVLGAAYAEAGQFDKAMIATRAAIELAKNTPMASIIPDCEARLKLFAEKKPYHRPAKTVGMPQSAPAVSK